MKPRFCRDLYELMLTYSFGFNQIGLDDDLAKDLLSSAKDLLDDHVLKIENLQGCQDRDLKRIFRN